MSERPLYGLLAEFGDADRLVHAARAIHGDGFRRIDAFSPFPVDGLAEAIGFTRNRIPLVVLLCGIAGGVLAYALQYYSAVVDYPFNIGGRPLHSWPAFIPVTFALTVLGATFGAFFGVLALNRLPQLYHPVFNVADFDTATRNRFFLLVEATDPKFDRAERVAGRLREVGARKVQEVPP